MWAKVLDSANFLWLLVLAVSIFTTVLGLVVTNAITVRRSHNGIRLWSEVYAGNQLTYLAFFFALFAAFDLKEMYKDLCIFVIVLSLLFFVLGLLNSRTHEQVVVGAKHATCNENCTEPLDPDRRRQIVGLNQKLASLSLLLTLVLIFALQYGKKTEIKQPLADVGSPARLKERTQGPSNNVTSAVPTQSAKNRPPTIQQSNSGGLNIQQATTGENSPIVNSPITVGSVPKRISQQDQLTLTDYLLKAKNSAKNIKITMSTDQYSAPAPFVTDFYDIVNNARWPIRENAVNQIIGFGQLGPARFKGVVIVTKGEPLKDGETMTVRESDPLFYIATVLQSLKVPIIVKRDPNYQAGVIGIQFEGGFPD
jgi:hypothetical protein